MIDMRPPSAPTCPSSASSSVHSSSIARRPPGPRRRNWRDISICQTTRAVREDPALRNTIRPAGPTARRRSCSCVCFGVGCRRRRTRTSRGSRGTRRRPGLLRTAVPRAWTVGGGRYSVRPIATCAPCAEFLRYRRGRSVEPIWVFWRGSCCFGCSAEGKMSAVKGLCVICSCSCLNVEIVYVAYDRRHYWLRNGNGEGIGRYLGYIRRL
jgi:hypothetical protein